MPARAPEIKTLIADDWSDYALIDSGEGEKLERVGPYHFVRPEPQALWRRRADPALWARADAVFTGGEDEEGGRWRFAHPLPDEWPMQWNGLAFLSRATPFRHLSFFPEHSVHWRLVEERLAARAQRGEAPSVLNLFGYTGLASLVAARAGARVTHIDASKKAIGHARANQAAANLGEAPIRWIVDDAHEFVRRELRRGRRYDGIILDPPKFGRGPDGETWRLEDGLSALLHDCGRLLSEDSGARFLIATVYAVRLSVIALAQAAREAVPKVGAWEIGEMALPHQNDERLLPTAIFARWTG